MTARVICGEALEQLRLLAAESIDALVTDPPAGISFMGKTWDAPGSYGYSDGADRAGAPPTVNLARNPTCQTCGGRMRAGAATRGCECDHPAFNNVELRLRDRIAFIGAMTAIFSECLRVMKPGAHGLVWAIPRTSHWTATALEDAGFEVRDVVTHLFGSGFPKSLDVSKAIDKAAGAEREVLGVEDPRSSFDGKTRASSAINTNWREAEGRDDVRDLSKRVVSAPATDAAKQWDGWGTALKPAAEHWLLVRKPLIGTVAANVQAHGTGALNIDASRIGYQSEGDKASATPQGQATSRKAAGDGGLAAGAGRDVARGNFTPAEQKGRWPANVVLSHNDDCEEIGTRVVKGDARAGQDAGARPGGFGNVGSSSGDGRPAGPLRGTETIPAYRCTGCAVAMLDAQSGTLTSGDVAGSKRSTDGGNGLTLGKMAGVLGQSYADTGGASRFFYCAKASQQDRHTRGAVKNTHPTVKSIELMRWLCRLITPPRGTILDCFAGSGSTGVAALAEGFGFIGIERSEEYAAIARDRIKGDFPLFNMVAP